MDLGGSPKTSSSTSWGTSSEGLWLQNTRVSDAGLGTLKSLKRLEVISLVATKATNEGVAELRKALPQARVVH